MSDEIERDELELDVCFVGAGPSGLAGAIHLADLITEHNKRAESGEGQKLEPAIAVIEKGAEPGSHMLSGAVMDPRGTGPKASNGKSGISKPGRASSMAGW